MSRKNFTILYFSLFFFVDPLVFFRVLLGNDMVSLGFAAILLSSIAFTCLKIWRSIWLPKPFWRILSWFIIYAIISTLVRLWLGQEFTYFIQHELVLIQALFIFVLLLQEKYRNYLFHAFVFSSFLHVITLLPFFDFIMEGLSQNTAYATGEYSTGIFTRRGTGFFNSSGQLSLFAIGALGLGLFNLENHRNKIGLILTINSIFLGIGSLSRSFIVASLLIIFLFVISSSLQNKFKSIALLAIATLLFLSSPTFMSYVEYINSRFSLLKISEQNDRLKGETGLEEGWNAVINYPFFGHPMLQEGKALWVWNGIMPVRPHLAIVFILGLYGFVLGLPLLILLLKAFKILILYSGNLLLSILKGKSGKSYNTFFLGFLGINLICLVEPLIETPIYFLFLFGIIFQSRAFNSIQNSPSIFSGLNSKIVNKLQSS